jgi:hypothetical protein
VRRARLGAAGAGLAAAALAAIPDPASAHGIVGRQDLPIPRWMFAWAAATVLVASFVGLAALWPKPRLQRLEERVVLRFPRLLDPLCGAIGVALFGFVVYAGLAGTQTATANIAPTFIYVIFWVGIPFASVLLGDVFRAFNPWRALARAVAWIGRRMGVGGADPLPYPSWLGRWPAALTILLFAWLELVYVNRDDPSKLAILALAYAAVQLVGMALYGIDEWEDKADGFSVYFGLFAMLSPLHWGPGELRVRKPLEGVVQLTTVTGTVALLCVAIGTTSFDGFSNGTLWNGDTGGGGIAGFLNDRFSDLGFGAENALQAAFTVGLVGMVLFVSALYRLGVTGMHGVGERFPTKDLARRFVHTLVPIALAYVVAHYFSLLVYQGQAVAYLASDPLGDGSDLFGTASSTIDYGVVSATGIWYVQVGALIVGHVCGLILAHDRALATYRDPRDATRSQYWMLAVMVAFTSLGLWILSAAAAQ